MSKKTFRKTKNIRKKQNKKSKKSKRIKNKIFRGGMNSLEYKAAIILAARSGSKRLVLIHKEDPAKRYEIDTDIGIPKYKNTGKYHTMKMQTGSTIHTKNFYVYVDIGNGTLVRVDGTHSLEAVQLLEQVAGALVEHAPALEVIGRGGGARVEPPQPDVAKAIRERAIPQLPVMIREEQPVMAIRILSYLGRAFFGIMFNFVTSFQEGEGVPRQQPRIPQENVPPAGNVPQLVRDIVVAAAPDASPAEHNAGVGAANELHEILAICDMLPQVREQPDGSLVVIPQNTKFMCVAPHNIGSNARAKFNSCNTVGPSDPRFEGQTWPTLTHCVEKCNE